MQPSASQEEEPHQELNSQHFDLDFLASRTVRAVRNVVYFSQSVIFCYSSQSRLTQALTPILLPSPMLDVGLFIQGQCESVTRPGLDLSLAFCVP